jgi:hypothetical protein
MPMILRSGRAKNSLPPVIRPRLPPLVRRHDTEFPGPVFSAQRNARQYTQWEVDISQHLALPETLDYWYFENSLRATGGDTPSPCRTLSLRTSHVPMLHYSRMRTWYQPSYITRTAPCEHSADASQHLYASSCPALLLSQSEPRHFANEALTITYYYYIMH